MELSNIFQEENDAIKRFSTIVFFVFIYYSLSYYFMTKSQDCIKKPHISKILLLLFLHIIHVLLLKYLHNEEMYAYMWIVALLPLFIYMLYTKYTEYQRKKEERKLKEMVAQFQAKQNNSENVEFMRNATPQKPNAPPMGGKQYVGISNNGNRRGDNIAYHQQQHNDPLPPSNPTPTYNNPIQIAVQQENMSNTFQQGAPQYDPNAPNNYRQNNTIENSMQPRMNEPLDMQPIGGQAGSLGGFDPYGGAFASF